MATVPLLAQAQAAFRQGRLPEALQLIDAVVKREPGNADAWNLAGVVCHVRRDHAAAARYFERALALGAGAGVLVNLGFAHQALGHTDQAGQAYAQATRRDPSLALAWQKLGGLQEHQGQRGDALESYRRAVALDPGDLRSLGDGLYLRRHLADWRPDAALSPDQLLQALAATQRSDFSPHLLLSLPEATAAQQRAAANTFAQSQWGPVLALPPLAAQVREPGGRMRIGYLSADFCEHAVSYLVSDVLAAHDREAVQVFVYAYRAAGADDPWRRKAIDAADVFVDLNAMDDASAAARIHADGVDVLVDLTGYTGSGRVGIAARRPAPVIAQWLGYIGTLGAPRLADYVIGDAVATPPAMAAHFSESLALLPRSFQPNAGLGPIAAPPARSAQGLPERGVVFCSFNQTYKFNPPLWDDWCEILRAVPGSVLWLAQPRDALAGGNLRREAQQRGVEGDRIVLAGKLPRDEHLARLALADVALDTTPYNSGTTASDALRVGVPLLAFLGETFASRMAGSLLHAAGLDECVAAGRREWVAMAIALGNDDRARAALRQRVQAAVPASGLFDPPAFARDLERLFAAMLAQRRAGERGTLAIEASKAPGSTPARIIAP
ncbi:MAG: tetratricopeptide repeat protein [Arenimonas sp.]|uniref:O-linked N-acetylglucosamine transferase, SPINDLY family protein n=1 Tax=Arenimonas sp. TaxID=1872635 RepID=UPI0025BC8094|nr:tetratricopeptide repeat protein [Arenimonas sp.]MBW8367884.1 tetratricopeptide repeat protein [Arenimonas sp.]